MNLQLSLKKNWFEMTKSGQKTEDYREITPYWIKRLFRKFKYSDDFTEADLIETLKNSIDRNNIVRLWQKQFTHNTMTLGYPKKGDAERILKIEHKGIEIRTGNFDWGAEPNKLYFVIKHGVCLNEA